MLSIVSAYKSNKQQALGIKNSLVNINGFHALC